MGFFFHEDSGGRSGVAAYHVGMSLFKATPAILVIGTIFAACDAPGYLKYHSLDDELQQLIAEERYEEAVAISDEMLKIRVYAADSDALVGTRYQLFRKLGNDWQACRHWQSMQIPFPGYDACEQYK